MGILIKAVIALEIVVVAVAWVRLDDARDQVRETEKRSLEVPAVSRDLIRVDPERLRELLEQPDGAWQRITLRVGEEHRFGGEGSTPGGADLICTDLVEGKRFACPHGGAQARIPEGAVGVPRLAFDALLRVESAPAELTQRDIRLSTQCDPDRSGVAFVRSASGRVYALAPVGGVSSARPESNRIELLCREVPIAAGGGAISLPVARTLENPQNPLRVEIERMRSVASSIPGGARAGALRGDFEAVASDPGDFRLRSGRRLVLEAPLVGRVEVGPGACLVAAAGIAPESDIHLETVGTVAVMGRMEGRIRLVRGSVLVHVSGDLTGEISTRKETEVVVEGDLAGRLSVRGGLLLFVGGIVEGTFDMTQANWSHFHFARRTTRAELESMKGDFRRVTLHLRESDLPPGEHEGIGSWHRVLVGGPD